MSRGVRGNALVKASERHATERLYLFGVKGNVCCHALVFGGLGVGPLVAPIEGVQLCVGVLKLKSQLLACADATMHGVPHFRFFVFETIGQRDAGPVFLAGRRVSNGLYIGLDDTLYPDCRMPLLTIDIEGDRSHERPDPVGADGREDFPVRPTMLTALQSGQCLALIRGRPFVDDRAPHAVALVYRTRPPDDGSKTHVVQPGVAEISLVDLPCSSGFTLPSCRQRIELARTAPAAVAAHHFFTCDPPFSFRRFAHILFGPLPS
jgi:hypothetical protein